MTNKSNNRVIQRAEMVVCLITGGQCEKRRVTETALGLVCILYSKTNHLPVRAPLLLLGLNDHNEDVFSKNTAKLILRLHWSLLEPTKYFFFNVRSKKSPLQPRLYLYVCHLVSDRLPTVSPRSRLYYFQTECQRKKGYIIKELEG